MRKQTTFVALLVVGLSMGLTGCGAPTPGLSNATSTPGGSASPGPSRSLRHADLCDTLPVEEVAKLTGLPLTFAINITAKKPLDLAECIYADAAKASDRVHQVSIDVAWGGGSKTLKKLVSQVAFDSDSLSAVTGLGDAAQGSDDGLAVLYGNDVVATTDGFEDTLLSRAVLTKLVTTMHDRLE